MAVYRNVFRDFIHTRSFQKKAQQEVVEQAGIGVTTCCMACGAVSEHHNPDLSAFPKRCCQHSKTLDAEYEKTCIGKIQV